MSVIVTKPVATKPLAAPAPVSGSQRRAPSGITRFFHELGGMVALFGLTIARAARPPYSYAPEFVSQLRFALATCWFPLVLTSFALSFGPAGVQASDFLGLFGALDRLGGAYVLITVREFAPLVAGIVIAGAVGTAVCADLGARVVREEMDALQVLGVDPIKSIVAPRLLVIVITCVIADVIGIVAGIAGALLVLVQNHAPIGPFLSTFFANGTDLEFASALLKSVLYGAIIAIVACYKGMNVSRGPESVGRAVNQTVVIAFLAIGAIDYAFTQYLLATHPILSEVHG